MWADTHMLARPHTLSFCFVATFEQLCSCLEVTLQRGYLRPLRPLRPLQVVLTDHEDKVLQNLRDCTASNSCAAPSCSLDTDSVASLSNASHEPTEQTTDRLQTSALCDSQPAAATEAADANTGTKAQGPAQPADQDLFDNAESCHDLDDFFKADASQTSGPHAPRGTTSWDYVSPLARIANSALLFE